MSEIKLPEPAAYRLTNTAFRTPVFEYHTTKEQAENRQADFNRSVDDGGLHNLTELFTADQLRATVELDRAGRVHAEEPVAVATERRMTNARHNGCAFDGWQCFHCGEVFETVGGARDHFGFDQSSDPACRIKLGAERGLLMALREAEKSAAEAWGKLHNESSEALVAMHAMRRSHREQFEAAENLGYERGLRDAIPQPSDPSEQQA